MRIIYYLLSISFILAIANKNGSVIMIGHIWSASFLPDFLLEVIPELQEKGYTFCTVSTSNAQKF